MIFSTFRCAALLVWHGIPVKHLPDILKSDFKDDGTIVDPFTGEVFHISPMVIPYLRIIGMQIHLTLVNLAV